MSSKTNVLQKYGAGAKISKTNVKSFKRRISKTQRHEHQRVIFARTGR